MVGDFNRKIILEDGEVYCGYGFGAEVSRVCEIVFNTSVVGYQEIVSDPSYTHQAVVMTYPVIGNYGIADDDFDSKALSVGALIVRDYNDKRADHGLFGLRGGGDAHHSRNARPARRGEGGQL